ncbi:MAG TPA: hypothetical protein ENI64_10450 [Gammaproteobacteria bacterium]|nr:hypothetical protein [Gammaproteobacteria bacterium]
MLFEKVSPTLNIDPYELAMLPMIRLSPDAEPSETYGDCGLGKLDSAYFDIVNTGLWSYQLYTYLELLQKIFGNNVKTEVSDWLLDMLNANNSAGDRLQTVFTVIEHAKKQARHAVMGTGKDLSSISVEMSMALAMLVELPESPDFSVSKGDRQTRIRLINTEVDQYFAASLKYAHDDVFTILLPILENLGAAIPGDMRTQIIHKQ